MTVSDFFNGIYLWLDSVAPAILLAGILIPLAGTALAWIGKRGNSHADGRFIANLFVGFSLGALLLAVFVMAFAVSVMDADPLQANVALLAAPVVCTVGCVLGIGRVFPVNQLASYRTFTDIALFLAACVVIVWLFSKFRGWGILFLGGIPQLLVIGLLAYVVFRRLYNRAFRGKSRSWV